MKRQIKIIILTIMFSFSTTAQAGFFQDLLESLKHLIGIDLSGEVNRAVMPPNIPCTNNIFPSAPEVIASHEEVESNAEETSIDFQPKSDSDADNLREDLYNNFTKLGGDPIALKQALCFYDKNRSVNFEAQGDPSRRSGIKIQNNRFITINDLNKSNFESRMFVLDLETGKIKSYYSAHGIGGNKGVAESSAYASEFSNKDGSYATPRGFFITGSRINGSSDPKQRWKFSMKLHGLQDGVNDNSYARAVVMHSFPDVENAVASSDDVKPILRVDAHPFYLSKGCTMIGPEVANEIVDTIKAPNNNSGGSLYYNYTNIEKSRGSDYCGDENLLKK